MSTSNVSLTDVLPARLTTWLHLEARYSPRARELYDQVEYQGPAVVFLGDERKGLSRRDLRLCDRVVRIPMVGRADSLNLAVAAGVILYHVFRTRAGLRE